MRDLALEFHTVVFHCVCGNFNINTLVQVPGPGLSTVKLSHILFTQPCKVYKAAHMPCLVWLSPLPSRVNLLRFGRLCGLLLSVSL